MYWKATRQMRHDANKPHSVQRMKNVRFHAIFYHIQGYVSVFTGLFLFRRAKASPIKTRKIKGLSRRGRGQRFELRQAQSQTLA